MNLDWMLGIGNVPWSLLALVILISSFGDLAGRASSVMMRGEQDWAPYRSSLPLWVVVLAFAGSLAYLGTIWKASEARDARFDQQAALISNISPDHDWALKTFRACAGSSVTCVASTLSLARENHRDVEQVKNALLKWGEFSGRPMGIDASQGGTNPQ